MSGMKTAQQLQQEVNELRAEIKAKNTTLERQDKQLKQKNTLITGLEAQIFALQKYWFGSSSEKDPNQLPLFNEAEQITESKPKVKTRSKKKKPGKRKPLPAELPREERLHDLKDDTKICPKDGAPLKHIGEATSEQLKFIPASVKVIKHVCYKYACPKCNKHIVTADKPKDPIPKSIATPELLSYITTCKYADGLPLYRLSQMFKRLNIAIRRTNMASWIIKCGSLVQPLINLLEGELIEQRVMHIDETTVQVLNEPGKKASSKSYFWVRRAANNILF